jgi:hypothetical protein
VPPAVFGGDCAVAVPAELIAAAVGAEGIEVTRRDPLWTNSIDSVGGLACDWSGGGLSGYVDILPQTGLDGAVLEDELAEHYFVECSWTCSWTVESDVLWISGTLLERPDLKREDVDRIGAQIGADIAARSAAAGADWERDRSDWWPVRECSDVAAEYAGRLGATVTAQAVGYHDAPRPATALADVASRHLWCAFSVDGRTIAFPIFTSGTAWGAPWAGRGEPVDFGVAGVDIYVSSQGGYVGGPVYELTDGVNVLTVELAPESPRTDEELVVAFAETFFAGPHLAVTAR